MNTKCYITILSKSICKGTGTLCYDVVVVEGTNVVKRITGVDSTVIYNTVLVANSKHNVVLTNFTLEKSPSGVSIGETRGAIPELKNPQLLQYFVLAVYENTKGEREGYLLLNSRCEVFKLSCKALYEKCRSVRRLGYSLVQNGIYRSGDEETVASYKGACFDTIPLTKPQRVKQVRSVVDTDSITTREVPKFVEKGKKAPATSKSKHGFTQEQLAELYLCKQNGIDPTFIANHRLSPEQMRVLWVAKLNGIPSEYFARPEFSVDKIKIFNHNVVNSEAFKSAYSIISPEYSEDQLVELFALIADGLDVKNYRDASKSADEIYEKRYIQDGISGVLDSSSDDIITARKTAERLRKIADMLDSRAK